MADEETVPVEQRENHCGRFRWIAFDAVGTLIYPDPPVSRVYFEAARRHGSRLSLEDVSQRFPRVFRESERLDSLAFRAHPVLHANVPAISSDGASERDRWRWIVAQIVDDVPDTEACFEELFTHFARCSAWRCFDDVAPALSALRAAGHRLAIASNFDERLHALCDGIDALLPIECRVISSEVRERKPNAGFYRALLAAAGCTANELLMVGDDVENDIRGARDAGLAALLIDRRSPARPGQLASLHELLSLESVQTVPSNPLS